MSAEGAAAEVGSEPAPHVMVWRDDWLPSSETFIRNQILALRRWGAVPAGVFLTSEDLGISPELALLRPSRLSHLAVRFGLLRYRFRAARRLAIERNVCVVHAHFGTGGVTVLPLARRLNVPLIVTFHGFDVTRLADSTTLKARLYRRHLPAVFRYASALVAVSEYVKQRLIELGAPAHKVRVLPIGVPLRNMASSTEDRQGIIFVGRLVEKKGASDLLKAASALRDEFPRLRLRILGSGPLERSLREEAKRLGVEAGFAGFVSSREVDVELERAAIFCGPSRTSSDGDAEGFGMVYLEAALHGLPVVAYDHGGVGEAVQDGVSGILAREGDVDSLADALRTLLRDDALCKRMGQAGRARVERCFNIEWRTSDLETLYDEVAGVVAPSATPEDRQGCDAETLESAETGVHERPANLG